ncbi:MAG: S41 family peptidase [Bacteroidales bacterium]|jgi:carboxyl-terminal processing protease|nr:S41 family peptidase [Bacteroidales bacterium]
MIKFVKYKVIMPLILALTLVGGILLGFVLAPNGDSGNLLIYPTVNKISGVIEYIKQEYVDTVSEKKLVETAIPAMLKELDPHSVYLTPEDLVVSNESLGGNFSGIGVQFSMQKDTVVVIKATSNGPSEKVGIMAGDRIVRINGETVAGIKYPQDSIVKKLRGVKGTKVTVGIRRDNSDEIVDYDIVRDDIPIYSVDVAYMIDATTGYIKINKFAMTTYQEFVLAVNKLKNVGMQRVIIDLRGNVGGIMDAATNIANEFLDKGKLIVYMQGKSRPRVNTVSNEYGNCLNDEVVILIDEYSASASEILAGAIQDNDRGTIIGRRSFGKGLVQNQQVFRDGSAIRLTVARYYTPTGRSIQKPYENGVEDYRKDILTRYDHGEFLERDSIRFNDSLKFVTPGGKIVYGGGGIMPDIFVPVDTVGITKYLNRISAKGLIYKFAFDYFDENRDNLTEYPSAEMLADYLKKKRVFNKFIDYAAKNGVKRNTKQLNESKDIIETQLYAAIARNVLDNEGFYPIIRNIDKTLNVAIEEMNK